MKKIFGEMTMFEKVWLVGFSLIIVGATIVFSTMGTDWSNWKSVGLNWIISPLSALTGVICVVLVAKGNINNYSFGIVNSALYGLVAWVSGYYGDWILNWFYFVPTQFLILLFWRNNLRADKPLIVKMKRLTPWQTVGVVLGGIGVFVAFGYLLKNVDFWFLNYMKRSESIYANITAAFGIPILGPMMDSSTEVLQVIAQILLIKRMAEQWPLWMATNVISIIMWGTVMVTDPTTIPWALPTLIMWVAFLINSIYGSHVWYRDSKRLA